MGKSDEAQRAIQGTEGEGAVAGGGTVSSEATEMAPTRPVGMCRATETALMRRSDSAQGTETALMGQWRRRW